MMMESSLTTGSNETFNVYKVSRMCTFALRLSHQRPA